MTRAIIGFGIACFLSIAAGCGPAAKPPLPEPPAAKPEVGKILPPIEEERKWLAGSWATEGWDKEDAKGWQCSLSVKPGEEKTPKVNIDLRIKDGSPASSGEVFYSKEADIERIDEKRKLVLQADAAKTAGLPHEIPYLWNGKELTIEIREGRAAGEYRLLRSEMP